jgi:VWFA-related protein
MKALWMSFAVAAIATAAVAQLHESITVQVVDVPVYVWSKSSPVRNLTRDDFELFVNGKRQTIDYFDRVDFTTSATPAPATASAPAEAPHDPRDRRMFLLLFDRATSRAAALARAQEAATSMIEHGGPNDYFSVVTWDLRNGAQFIVPFMNDHVALKTAVKRFLPRQDPLALATTSIAPRAEAMFRAGNFGTMMREMSDMPEKRMIADQFDDFSSIADRLAVLEGYKHVVLFSEGVNPQMIFAGRVEPHLMDLMHEMMTAFVSAGAFIDAIDLGSSLRSTSESDALRAMALDTGGQFIHWQNDLKSAVARLSTTTSTVYRLGFKPVNPKPGENRIDVKVRNVPRGTSVSYRRGFSPTQEYPRDAGYDTLRLADIVLNDIPQNGITATTAIEKRDLVVTVPTKILLASHEGLGVTADVIVYVFDKSGNAVDFIQKQAVLTPDDQSDVVFRQPLKIAPGQYVVKTLMRARKSIGYTKQTVTVQ